jgi:NRAMP (natural resistance-associated macrophage protein)-like metal ion transporter
LLIGVAAFLLLLMGVYQAVERTLMLLVVVMSCCFLVTAVMVGPHMGELIRGLFAVSFPSGAGKTVIALIGTTIVPYNLFLHASIVSEKWSHEEDVDQSLRYCRRDTILAVGLGGCVTMAILVTSAASFFAAGIKVDSAGTMARQLEPLLGSNARYLFAAGLFAAGMTSAVTAPLAAAYATCGALGWPKKLRSRRFSLVWILVIVVGTLLATLTGKSPIQAILFAQAANGLLLPVVVVFLLVVMNRANLLGRYTNNMAANVIGALVALIAGAIGVVAIVKLFLP